MINNDLIQFTLTAEQKASIEQALNTISDVVKTAAPNLSNEERQEYGSVAEQNKLIIDKGRMYMGQFPELVPSFIDLDEFERDYQARTDMSDVLSLMNSLQRQVSDIKILLDYDNYQDVLCFYRSVRYYSQEQEKNAITVYNDMKQFFPRTGTK